MIINNSNITGIYLFDPNATYEKGDFVVSGDKIFNCLRTVSGETPESSPSFRLYLSDEVSTTQEVIKYIEEGRSSELDNKLISAKTLGELLSRYMSGYSDRGMITNRVMADSTIVISDYFNNTKTQESQSLNPLDVILETRDLNNAVFLVDPEVINSLSITLDTFKLTVSEEVLLRQYTYRKDKDKDKEAIRVQEIIDHRSGNILFRYAKEDINTKSFSSLNTSWNTSLVFSKSQLYAANEVRNYYFDKCNKLLVREANSVDDYVYTKSTIRGYYDSGRDSVIIPVRFGTGKGNPWGGYDWSGVISYTMDNNDTKVEQFPFTIPRATIDELSDPNRIGFSVILGTLPCGSTVMASKDGAGYFNILTDTTSQSQASKPTGVHEIIIRYSRQADKHSFEKIWWGSLHGDPVTDNPYRPNATDSSINHEDYIISVSLRSGATFTDETFLITINPSCQKPTPKGDILVSKKYAVTFTAQDVIKNRHMSYTINDANIFDQWTEDEIKENLGISDMTGVNIAQNYKIAFENVVVNGLNQLESFLVRVNHRNSVDGKLIPFYSKNRPGQLPIRLDWIDGHVTTL